MEDLPLPKELIEKIYIFINFPILEEHYDDWRIQIDKVLYYFKLLIMNIVDENIYYQEDWDYTQIDTQVDSNGRFDIIFEKKKVLEIMSNNLTEDRDFCYCKFLKD